MQKRPADAGTQMPPVHLNAVSISHRRSRVLVTKLNPGDKAENATPEEAASSGSFPEVPASGAPHPGISEPSPSSSSYIRSTRLDVRME